MNTKQVVLRLYRRFPLTEDLSTQVLLLRSKSYHCQVIEREGQQWFYVDANVNDDTINHLLSSELQQQFPFQQNRDLAHKKDNYSVRFLRLVQALWQLKVVVSVLTMTLVSAIHTQLGDNLSAAGFWLVVEFQEGIFSRQSLLIEPLSKELGIHSGLEFSYRLLAPIFLHFGGLHWLFNALWWLVLGTTLEKRFGSLFFFLLIVTGGVISNLVQYGFTQQLPLFGGLSGVIYVFVGFVGLWNVRAANPLPIKQDVIVFMVLWLVLCMSGVMESFGLYVANAAHFSGLVWGIICGLGALRLFKQPT